MSMKKIESFLEILLSNKTNQNYDPEQPYVNILKKNS